MGRVSKKALRHEAKMLGLSMRGRMSEFCDSWMVIGVRAGTDDAIHVSVAATKKDEQKLESVLAMLALDVVQRRKKCHRARRKK